jgi:hypothetical protein
MTLSRDPDREYQARRTAILGRFTAGAHVDPAEAERWIAAWERRADALGMRTDSSVFWSAGLRWIAAERDRLVAASATLRDAS